MGHPGQQIGLGASQPTKSRRQISRVYQTAGAVMASRHPGRAKFVPQNLRVNGAASIHDAPELLEQCAHRGRLPLTVIRVAVEEVFLHCAKALLRSKLWQPETWPEARPVASMGEMIRDHGGLDGPAESDAEMSARHLEALAAEGRG